MLFRSRLVAITGVGSVAVSALVVLLLAMEFLADRQPLTSTIYTWISVGGFNPAVSFYVDGLTLTMLSVITGVGLLIHIYSSLFMLDDADYSRFFSYMNLFVSAMLVLVLADNLLLLFVGWEGVGLCSYLLVGFWHDNSANGAAARKAFIVTRVGDTAMALGMFILFLHLGTLDFEPMTAKALALWPEGDTMLTIACLLLLGGAVGKSAQLPLQTWLPDAMAGPTPVSALIHAATMVTAGVYLIARTHDLFLLSPVALNAVAVVGAATLLMAAFTAMTQHDIKRILAYSTISQLSYVVLGAAIATKMAAEGAALHIVMHAVGKITLFFVAGAIYVQAHITKISQLDGQGPEMKLVFAAFFIGAMSIIGIPPAGGSWSKFMLMVGAADAGMVMVLIVLGVSSLLNIYYLLDPVARAFFKPKAKEVKIDWHPLTV